MTDAVAALAPLGMNGVIVHKVIDAFVGDRLMEALWREALWLVHDDVCDVETLDDVICYSFGLHWTRIDLLQSYPIAGGEAGTRHFLAQLGLALSWPWSRLTGVVDLDDALVDKIAAQSDAQNAGLSVRELERIRDNNLFAIFRALRSGNGGRGRVAGLVLADFEADLKVRASAPAFSPVSEWIRSAAGASGCGAPWTSRVSCSRKSCSRAGTGRRLSGCCGGS